MTTAMKAAFTLTLEDKLTKGLQGLQKDFQKLRDSGKGLNLGKLERGAEVVSSLGREIKSLTSDLRGVEVAADRGWAALKRLASTKMQSMKNWGQNNLGPQGKIGGQLGLIGGAVAGYSVLKPVQSYADFQNIALHSAITQGLAGGAATAETKRLMALFSKDALEAGQPSTAVAQAFQDLIQTGMTPARAEALLPIHSRAATAYNISPEALGHAVFALSDSFKINEQEMPGALASMALASKEGRFKVEDFSAFLPAIGGNLARLGMTGRGSADAAFAALETVMKYSSTPGTGFADFSGLLNDIVAPHSARTFALHNRGMAPETKALLSKYHVKGINLPALLDNAGKRGIDPITAVMAALNQSLHGLPQIVKAEVLGAFFGNSESRTAAMAILDHQDEMNRMRKGLGRADAGLLDRDFNTAHGAPVVTLRTGEEAATQLERRAGEGFEPVVTRLVAGLERIVGGVESLDKKLPGLADAVFATTGAMLAAISALAAAGFVAPAVRAGWSLAAPLLLNPATSLLVGTGIALKIGSDAETPENRAALDRLSRDRRSGIGGLNDLPNDGYGIDGRPLNAPPLAPMLELKSAPHESVPAPFAAGADGVPSMFQMPEPPPPGTLDITIHTEPGTTATINRASDGVNVKTPDPGQTTNQP